MPKRSANEYAGDDGFIDDGSASPPQDAKRTKTNGASSSVGNALKMKEGGASRDPAPQTDDNGENYWELSAGGKRRVTISAFNGRTLVNVREYYESNGKKLPGKKGIGLSIEQFSALIDVLPQIEKALKTKGESIPRPDYDIGDAAPGKISTASDKSKPKSQADEKQNFEATSDEDEG